MNIRIAYQYKDENTDKTFDGSAVVENNVDGLEPEDLVFFGECAGGMPFEIAILGLEDLRKFASPECMASCDCGRDCNSIHSLAPENTFEFVNAPATVDINFGELTARISAVHEMSERAVVEQMVNEMMIQRTADALAVMDPSMRDAYLDGLERAMGM